MFNIVELNATVDELRPVNEAITKNFEEKQPTEVPATSTSELPKETQVKTNKKDLSLTKEVEAPPVVNDPSPKLNRTFRKMVPLAEKQTIGKLSEAGNLDTTTVKPHEIVSPNVSTVPTLIANTTEELFDAITEEPKKPNRKRILGHEKKNPYPYYLGRVLG